MKLLTHNMLACTIKGVKNGFPLKIEAEEVVEREADFDPGKRRAGRLARWQLHVQTGDPVGVVAVACVLLQCAGQPYGGCASLECHILETTSQPCHPN